MHKGLEKAAIALVALTLGACMEIPTKRVERRKDAGDTSSDGASASDGGGGGNDGSAGDGDGANGMDGGADSSTPLVPECSENAECGENELCSPTQQCVECTDENTELCPAGRKLCEDGLCVACIAGEEDCQSRSLSRCDPVSHACIACEDAADCSQFGDGSVCLAGECVECATNQDCDDRAKSFCDPTTHRCEPCRPSENDCGHLDETPICDSTLSKCVPCLPANRTACGGKVCDMTGEEPVCADAELPRSASVCQPCVSDEQCASGQVCVNMHWDADNDGVGDTEVGWFCQWQLEGGGSAPEACDTNVRPYVGERSATTADRLTSVTICTLAVSTCPAHANFRRDCGRFDDGAISIIVENRFDPDIPDGPVAAEQITPDDGVCGIGGRCVVKNQSSGAYQCSVGCGNNTNDCPVGPFSCGGSPPGTASICGI